MAKVKNETTTETLPVAPIQAKPLEVAPAAPVAAEVPANGWTAEFQAEADSTKAAYLDYKGKHEAERAAALVHGEKLTALHTQSDKNKYVWKEVLAKLGIPQTTASSHEAYFDSFGKASEAITGIGGDPLAFSIPAVKAIANNPEKVNEYEANGKPKAAAEPTEAQRLLATIERTQAKLAEVSKPKQKQVKVKAGAKVVIDGVDFTVEEGGILIVVE